MMLTHDSIRIEPAGLEHVRVLSRMLRADDAAEIEAAGFAAFDEILDSVRHSTIARVATLRGDICAMWGLDGSPLSEIGRPWLLTAPPIERIKMAFVRVARSEVASMLCICPRLQGYVDARYVAAHRFLLALGFHLDDPVPFGSFGALFRRYAMVLK